MRSLTIRSPAKVNLFLKVLGVRRDGYHELITLFHRISLSDRLTLRKINHPEFSLTTHHLELPKKEDNLIYQAHCLLRTHVASWKGGVGVTLEKRIPLAAGLGGGSSNAAHFLLGVNRLFGLSLPLKTLVRIAGKLGSDVPFFLYEVNQAIGRARGEAIEPLPFLKKLWFVLILPPFRLSTRQVYKRLSGQVRLTRISHDATITSDFFRRCAQRISTRMLSNDLFQASSSLRPELNQLDVFLGKVGASRRLMSGSGPAMFSIHDSNEEAVRVARRIRRQRPELGVFISHTYS